MWQLLNHTPFAAERTWVRDMNGAEVWIVAVKGTFVINPDGSTEIAEKQEDICRVPQFLGEPGKSSLKYESDLIHTKPMTDILLHGHAYAPRFRPVQRVDVTMKVGALTKTLRVFGDRYWNAGTIGMEMTMPEPFEKMPLIYERAFGGVDQISNNPKKHGWEKRNPVGTGFAMEAGNLVSQRVPNIEDPIELITSWKQRPRPAGFGPIARHWSPRVESAGTYDEKWEEGRLPLPPLDFSEQYYQAAPEDQQSPVHLRGGEMIGLNNLTPDGVLKFKLPKVVLDFRTNFGKELVEHRANLHSLILEPDYPRVMMTWHTMLPCHHQVYKLQATTVRQKEQIEI